MEKVVIQALDDLHTGDNYTRRFAVNIDAEFRLSEEMWQEVFGRLVKLPTLASGYPDTTLIANEIRAVFREMLKRVPDVKSIESCQPVGPPISGLNPRAYGRVVSKKQLISLWQWAAPAKSAPRSKPKLTPDQVEALIDDISIAKDLSFIKRTVKLSEFPVGRFIIWSTFDAENLDLDPFYPRSTTISRLIASLGLDSLMMFDRHPRDLSNPSLGPIFCVLLTYGLPTNVTVHIPTVVEAYAGPGRMNYYFEVWRSKKGDFPRTLPDPYYAHGGRPEVVHSVVFADMLLNPIEVEKVR